MPMTEIERYLFDVNGYLVVENALTSNQLSIINELMDEKLKASPNPQVEHISFPEVHKWRGPMLDLIDNPRIATCLEELCTQNFRLDHTYAFHIRPGVKDSGAYILHCGGAPFDPCIHYAVHQSKIYCAQVAVVYLLNDAHEGDGGFGCIPGTHKSNFNIPEEFRDLRKAQPAVKNVVGPAGSAIVFTETLSHGTLQWTGKQNRRTIYYKYTPHCIGLNENYLDEGANGWPELTRRQREILEAPNVRSKDRKRINMFV